MADAMPDDTPDKTLHPANAGVHFPPPFIYALGILAGWLLDRWRPWPIGGGTLRLALAIAGVLLWLVIFGSAAVAFRRFHTTLVPNKPATALVRTGPYRFTRNPMYVSLVALYIGAALFVGTWWSFVLLPVVVLAIDRMVIAREERYLTSAFPAEYPELRARVRRWI